MTNHGRLPATNLGRNLFAKRLLIWDSFRCHISKDPKVVLNALKLDLVIIPGGCTQYIQPAEWGWNKPLKDKVQDLHDEWLLTGNLPGTQTGNPVPPPPQVYLDWVVNAWKEISSDIRRSITACGIGVKNGGSEDHLIHVFKHNGPCPEGTTLLAQERLHDRELIALEEEVQSVYDSDQDNDDEDKNADL